MLHVFLTSSPTGPLDGSRPVQGIDKWNGFAERLHAVWPEQGRCLMIASDPGNFAMMDGMTGFFWQTWLGEGFSMACMDKLDNRYGAGVTAQITQAELQSYDVLFLAGGHVPTQNAFFHSIQLREKLQGFTGIIIGISAGSMNSADVVYMQPEEPGEAVDPHFVCWGQGLGLTQWMLAPHYQMVKDNILDGLRLYQDITIPQLGKQELLLLTDGSYLEITKASAAGPVEQVLVHGEAYIIREGVIEPLCGHEESRELTCK